MTSPARNGPIRGGGERKAEGARAHSTERDNEIVTETGKGDRLARKRRSEDRPHQGKGLQTQKESLPLSPPEPGL